MSYIDDVFGPNGYLAQRFSGYRSRPRQLAFAQAVDDAITNENHLMAEGSTGLGKSLAYLVPSIHQASAAHERILAARKNPEVPNNGDDMAPARVLVVTAGITLSEQLVGKDLPLLQEVLPWPFTFALMKGRGNYLCSDAYYDTEAKGHGFLPNADETDQIEDIRAWAKDVFEGFMKGDVSELPFEPTPRVWRNFSVANDECKGKDCDFYKTCPSNAAHGLARKANVIVTNYHMLFAHLQVRKATNMDLVLPPCDTIILDECHSAANVARDFFGFRITQEMIGRTARALKKNGEDQERQLEKELRNAAGLFFSCLLAYKASGRYKTRIKEPLTEDEGMVGVWCGLEAAMLAVEKVLTHWSNQLNYVIGDGRGSKEERARMAALARSCDRSAELRGCIRTAMELTHAEEHVYFIDTNEKQQVLLVGKPIDVGPILEDALFRRTPTVVCTSATMCVRDSFDFIANEVGCPSYAQLIAESPFDWERQALLVLPDWMPEPNVLEFKDAVVDATERVVAQAKGRTLGLFTSRKMLDYVFEAMKKSCRYRLMKQGQMPRTKLIEAFKKDESSVLLGTESFWAGVDVPGKALSAVVIDRLPFPAPDDPIADAMSIRDPKGWFRHYSIPRAVIQLKQGVGRLIRAVDDVGVAVILDRRVLSKPYGKIFLKSLPRALSITTRIEDIGPFLNRKSPDEIDEMSSAELEDAFT
jgi:ATP-dependent DNA helicase DinG